MGMEMRPGLNRRSMLLPVAYSESVMPALRLSRSSRLVQRIAGWLAVLLCLSAILIFFAPWQQSVTGQGNVIAFAPLERQQVIESPIKGRITSWGPDVVENSRVAKGQLIAVIEDLDESYFGRLEDQLRASESQYESAKQNVAANERALESARVVVTSYEAQVKAYNRVKIETIAAQDAYVEMAQEKVSAEEQQLAEYQAAIPQIEAELARLKTLQTEGNVALQKVQEVERKLSEAQAKVNRGEAYVKSAKAELEGKTREREAKIQKAQVDIDYAEAMLNKAHQDVSKAEADIAKADQEKNKAEKDVLESRTKVSRQASQNVYAPFDGFLVQINANLRTSVLKEGDPLCVIVPDTKDRAVQIWLDGNDAPLVEPGRHVRLQFEGWPALQFAGWPSVAVGTFGGEIVSVDSTDNGMGQFRALIRPATDDLPWPEDRFLRQGVRANGWVLLEQVPLWFEIWRNLNGFPVVTFDKDKAGGKAEDKSKPPKLPK